MYHGAAAVRRSLRLLGRFGRRHEVLGPNVRSQLHLFAYLSQRPRRGCVQLSASLTFTGRSYALLGNPPVRSLGRVLPKVHPQRLPIQMHLFRRLCPARGRLHLQERRQRTTLRDVFQSPRAQRRRPAHVQSKIVHFESEEHDHVGFLPLQRDGHDFLDGRHRRQDLPGDGGRRIARQHRGGGERGLVHGGRLGGGLDRAEFVLGKFLLTVPCIIKQLFVSAFMRT